MDLAYNYHWRQFRAGERFSDFGMQLAPLFSVSALITAQSSFTGPFETVIPMNLLPLKPIPRTRTEDLLHPKMLRRFSIWYISSLCR
jgi:hypothetical protein